MRFIWNSGHLLFGCEDMPVSSLIKVTSLLLYEALMFIYASSDHTVLQVQCPLAGYRLWLQEK